MGNTSARSHGTAGSSSSPAAAAPAVEQGADAGPVGADTCLEKLHQLFASVETHVKQNPEAQRILAARRAEPAPLTLCECLDLLERICAVGREGAAGPGQQTAMSSSNTAGGASATSAPPPLSAAAAAAAAQMPQGTAPPPVVPPLQPTAAAAATAAPEDIPGQTAMGAPANTRPPAPAPRLNRLNVCLACLFVLANNIYNKICEDIRRGRAHHWADVRDPTFYRHLVWPAVTEAVGKWVLIGLAFCACPIGTAGPCPNNWLLSKSIFACIFCSCPNISCSIANCYRNMLQHRMPVATVTA